MKISRISRPTIAPKAVSDGVRRPRRAEVLRTAVAVTLAVALVGTGAIALPSLAPVVLAGIEIPPTKGPQLEPEDMGDVENIAEAAGTLGRPLNFVTLPVGWTLTRLNTRLLDARADVNAKENWGGQSALMWAAAQSQAVLVRECGEIVRVRRVHYKSNKRAALSGWPENMHTG